MSQNLTHFVKNGIELLINTETGETFSTQNGYARMSGISQQAVNKRLNKDTTKERLVRIQIDLGQGIQGYNLIPEDLIIDWLPKDNPSIASQLLRLGVRAFLHQLAGFKVQSTAITVKTRLELAKEQVRLIEELEKLEAEKEQLEIENQALSEAVDELFDYSSIIRIAKFNGISETNFSWRLLKGISKKMNKEVKKVPCPRFETKNLYSHDVWRYAYPDIKLPETNTLLVINKHSS